MIECKIFHGYVGTGLAILTGSYRFFVINNINEGHSRKMVEVPGKLTIPLYQAKSKRHISIPVL